MPKKALCLLLCTLFTLSLYANWSSKDFFVSMDKNTRLFCRLFGDGDPVIVIHGGPGLGQNYLQPHMRVLADHHQVLFYDQRAAGSSQGPFSAEVLSPLLATEDLDKIIENQGWEKVTLVGHAWGSTIGLAYAMIHPDKVSKLVLMNPMPLSTEELGAFATEIYSRLAPYEAELVSFQSPQLWAQGGAATATRYYRVLFKSYMANPQLITQLDFSFPNLTSAIQSVQALELAKRILFMQTFDMYDSIQLIQTPTLILHGESDPTPQETIDHIHRCLNNSEVVTLEECGHFPFLEAKQETFKAIENFLNTP